MAYNFTPFKDKIKHTEDWLRKEYTAIRTGQASPAVLDNVMVGSYGSMMPVSQVASIAIEDSKSLRIAPWDISLIKEIEKALVASGLGLSIRTDEKGVRASFPALTEERRGALIKLAKEKLEEARISLRKEREPVVKDLESQQKAGTMQEDEAKRMLKEVQKLVDEANKKFDEIRTKKEAEIQS